MVRAKKLATAREVMDALGGIGAVADAVGVGYTAAHNWASGVAPHIPARLFNYMTSELQDRGCIASPALWGQYPDWKG